MKSIFLLFGLALSGNVLATTGAIHIQSAAYNGSYCLNLQSGEFEHPTNVYGCGDSGDQLWEITPAGEYGVSIRNPKYNTCLNVQDSNDFTATNAYGCGFNPDQIWKITPTNCGQILIESTRAPGKCLKLTSGYNEAPTVLFSCDASDEAQLWNVY